MFNPCCILTIRMTQPLALAIYFQLTPYLSAHNSSPPSCLLLLSTTLSSYGSPSDVFQVACTCWERCRTGVQRHVWFLSVSVPVPDATTSCQRKSAGSGGVGPAEWGSVRDRLPLPSETSMDSLLPNYNTHASINYNRNEYWQNKNTFQVDVMKKQIHIAADLDKDNH